MSIPPRLDAHCILQPTLVRGGLYLGSEGFGQRSNRARLQDLQIYLIVNVTPRCPNYHQDHIPYIRVAVNDEPSAPLGDWFDGVVERMEQVLVARKSVYVHCQMGISRSSSLVLAYLMRFHHLSLEAAHQLTKERRPVVAPNIGFWKQLKEYEGRLSVQSPDVGRLTTTAVKSMIGFFRHPNNPGTLNKSLVGFGCILDADRTSSLYASIRIDSESAYNVPDVLGAAMTFVYDNALPMHVAWLSHVVTICKAHESANLMLDIDSRYMQDYWAGEWNEKTAQVIRKGLQRSS
jgi:protein-tyrosine phosphatase